MKKIYSLHFIFILCIGVILSGCAVGSFRFGNNDAELGPAGVWRSTDFGSEWRESGSLLIASGPARTIMGTPLITLVPDPSDPQAWYAPAGDNGLFFTIDNGQGWTGTLGGSGTVMTVAIDPVQRCTLYAGAGSTVMKSTDCARSWAPVFQDPRPNARVNSIMIDFRFPRTVYAGLETGDLIRSTDAGAGWTPVFRFPQAITDFRIGPTSNRNLYVTTRGGSLWRSVDQGANWVSFQSVLQQVIRGSENIVGFFMNANENILIVATPQGLARSEDAGQTWTSYRIITAPDQTNITSLYVDPGDPNRILYTVRGTLYRSFDGGNTWATRALPSRRSVGAIRADRQQRDNLWLVFEPETR